MGMVELAHRFHFPLEPGDGLRVPESACGQHLDCDRTLEPGVHGPVDRPHAALADLLLDLVLAQPCGWRPLGCILTRLTPDDVADLLGLPDLFPKLRVLRQRPSLALDVGDHRVFEAIEGLQNALAGRARLDMLPERLDGVHRQLAQRQVGQHLPGWGIPLELRVPR